METGHINLMTRRALRDALDAAGFDPVEEFVAGLYLPGLAETFGDRAVRIEAAGEHRLRGTRAQGMLWTQFVVARPRGTAVARGDRAADRLMSVLIASDPPAGESDEARTA